MNKINNIIALNMIVRNESKIIERCLKSTFHFVDYYFIDDTGSSDNTVEIIQNLLTENNKRFKINNVKWINFEHNRNQVLERAKESDADFILFMDADETVEFPTEIELDKESSYFTNIKHGNFEWKTVKLINNHKDWCWKGVVHEYLYNPRVIIKSIDNFNHISFTDGARNKDPDKYKKDIALLEKALVEDQLNSRYTFYLAQSYRDDNNIPKAIEFYKKRSNMEGWEEETWYALYQYTLLNKNNMLMEDYITQLKYLFELRSSRAEALYFLLEQLRIEERYQEAEPYLFYNPTKSDVLFLDFEVYDWKLKEEQAALSFYVGNYKRSKELYQQLCTLENNENLMSFKQSFDLVSSLIED